jgi:hypothetical protein
MRPMRPMRAGNQRGLPIRTIAARAVVGLATVIAVGAAGGAAPLAAQSITVQPVSCFRFADNQVVRATTLGEPGGATTRLYFQWTEHPYYYWVDFEHDGPGRYWVTPPKPETRNKEIEFYGVLLDGAGRELARSQILKSKVTSDCQVKLTPQQLGAAQNLTIGETSSKQLHNRVNGFLCDGIVTRVNPENIKRADETCRTCVVAWWLRKELLIPVVGAAGLTGVTSVVSDQPEPSPSRP